jgi:hypothetical protein
LCAGASADNYLLAAKQASGVQPGTGKLDLADISQATKTPDGTLVTLFTMRLDPSQAAPSASTDCMCVPTAAEDALDHADYICKIQGDPNESPAHFGNTALCPPLLKLLDL